jgi:tight adherence protein B
MTLGAKSMYLILGGGMVVVLLLLVSAFGDNASDDLQRRLIRVGPGDGKRRSGKKTLAQGSLRSTKDSSIPLLDLIIKKLPNPGKLRARLARTGRNITLGEYLLVNALAVVITFFLMKTFSDAVPLVDALVAIMVGLGLPHMVVGIMGGRRIKKFLASFPEAIDTMCRGLRSGLPVAESIAAVGREMPDPVGIEFHRISDSVRLGKSLEDAMWDVAYRLDTPEFRFLIIAMAIQKETGGNLAETMGNLSDLIRKRRQLRLKIKAMSSEAKASAMIIGSLPFIMFTLLMFVSPNYVSILLHDPRGKMMLGGAGFWMFLGWAIMGKMIRFEI